MTAALADAPVRRSPHAFYFASGRKRNRRLRSCRLALRRFRLGGCACGHACRRPPVERRVMNSEKRKSTPSSCFRADACHASEPRRRDVLLERVDLLLDDGDGAAPEGGVLPGGAALTTFAQKWSTGRGAAHPATVGALRRDCDSIIILLKCEANRCVWGFRSCSQRVLAGARLRVGFACVFRFAVCGWSQ